MRQGRKGFEMHSAENALAVPAGSRVRPARQRICKRMGLEDNEGGLRGGGRRAKMTVVLHCLKARMRGGFIVTRASLEAEQRRPGLPRDGVPADVTHFVPEPRRTLS